MPSAFFLVSDEGPATSTGAGPTIGAPAGGAAAHDGETLTADPGTWNGTGTLTYGYQWQRCDANGANCHDIAGATLEHLHADRRGRRGDRPRGHHRDQRRGHVDAHRLGPDRRSRPPRSR